jgi:hypothetical protein
MEVTMHIEETGSPELGAGRSVEAALKGRTVRVHIDREPYETKTPTTGAALYALAGIGPKFELFREAAGEAEDEFIARNDAPVHLSEDEHFYSQKDYRIVVNAREVFVESRRLSYDQVVSLAFNPMPVGTDIIFTVTYRKGPRQNPKGTLAPGESVVIKNGMIFVVTQTNRS